MTDWTNTRVAVTGGGGFLGRILCTKLRQRGCRQVAVIRRSEYDLTTSDAAARMYAEQRPDVVIHLAAEVGGIGANSRSPGRFFYANMAMGLHLIEEARKHRIAKFVHTASVCAYPKFTPVPFREESIWDGYPEETNAPYGVAKKALMVMLDAYHAQYGLPSAVVLPANLFGPGDNFDPASSHVIPALIRKCIEAIDRGDDAISCWGTGSASREFLYVGGAGEGIVAAAERMEDPTPINLGTGKEVTIKALVEKIARLTGFAGRIEWDADQPDGQPRRCLDTARAVDLLNWRAKVDFEEGLRRTIDWYRSTRTAQAA